MATVALVVEVVSQGSHREDRFRKPVVSAGEGVPYFDPVLVGSGSRITLP